MNCLSYCLFGSAPLYNVGAIRNAEMARDCYPGWERIFYVDEETVPAATADKLESLGAQVRLYSSKTDPNGMFVRFFIGDDPDVERFIVRDVDSRPCQREVNAVQAWIDSQADFHVMRDHPFHAQPMLGGLWGAVGGALNGITKAAKAFHRYETPYTRQFAYGADQEFLAQYVWPRVLKSGIQHDSCTRDKFPNSVDFPDQMRFGDYRFVGEVFDSEDKPDPVHWQMRLPWMQRAA